MIERASSRWLSIKKELAGAKLSAIRNSERSWERIDKKLNVSGFCDDPRVLSFATRKLDHPNGNVRELAVSIFERSTKPLKDEVHDKLVVLMDKDLYNVRYRCAFALFSKGGKTEEVMATLRGALSSEVPAYSQTAVNYLSQTLTL